MNKLFELNIDLKRKTYNNVRGLKQGDNNSVLNITLTQDNIPFDLTDCVVRINYRRTDGKVFLQMADVVDSKKGQIKVNVLTKVLEKSGTSEADLSIFDKNNRKITSVTFSMFVDASVYTNDYLEPEDLDMIQDIYIKEEERIANERNRVKNEEGRKSNENTRIKNENERKSNENTRIEKENERIEKENERIEKEKDRVKNENTRKANEDVRKSNEDERIKNENTRKANENIRIKKENERIEKEDIRIENESNRVKNEDSRKSNENERKSNENTRIENEKNRQQGYSKMNSRIDNLVLGTGSPAEVIDAHLDGATGEKYPTLKERLDNTSEKIKENATKEVTLKDGTEHLDGGVDGILNINNIGGNTLYKRENGTYTDTWEENVELESVKDKVEIVCCGKNLCDNKLQLKEIKYNTGEEYKVDNIITTVNYIKIQKDKDLNIKLYYKDNILDKAISGRWYDENKNYIGILTNRPSNAVYLRLRFLNGTPIKDIENYKFMLSYEDVSYEPYKEDKTTIQLKEPLRSLPNGTKDELLADGTLVRRIGKTVLNGSEEWKESRSNDDFIRFYVSINCKGGIETTNTISDNILSLPFFKVVKTNIEGVATGQKLNISISKSKLPTPDVEGFKQWLSENPTTLLYELEEPIVEKIEPLKPLKCWSGGSLIVNSNINPIVNFKYPTNLNSRLSSVEENTLNNSNFVKEQNAVNLDFDLRLTSSVSIASKLDNMVKKEDLDKKIDKEELNKFKQNTQKQLDSKADKKEFDNFKQSTGLQLAETNAQLENTKGTISSELDTGKVSTPYTRQLIASTDSKSSSERGVIIGSVNSEIDHIPNSYTGGVVILASRRVKALKNNTVIGGYGSGSPSTKDIKWELDSKNGTIKTTGAITGNSTFADFAEYFESVDGKSIPTGTIVTLENDKIRPCKENEEMLGVISETAGVLLNACGFHWRDRYIKNEFGGLVYERIYDKQSEQYIMIPKENPQHDIEEEYISREDREEWNIVGLTGQVHVRIDNTIKMGDFIKPSANGIATKDNNPTWQRWRVMKVTTPYNKEKDYGVALVFIR